MARFAKSLKTYATGAEGSMTLLGLYLGVAMLIVGALALDVSNLISVRTQLQSAADFAAHAALYQRAAKGATPDAAKAAALQLVENVYPKARYGEILKPSDIHFGSFDAATGGFKIDENSTAAAVAFTKRSPANGNPVAGFLSKLFGYNWWSVQTASVFETFRPSCLRDGWVGEDVVDAQSNNAFLTGFCVHSNTEVQFNQNSLFEPGVEVSTPDGKEKVTVPADDYSKNIGLEDAISASTYNLRILENMSMIFDNIDVKDSEYEQSYLPERDSTDSTRTVHDITGTKLTTADFQEGAINSIMVCSGNKTLTIDATPVLQNVAIITNCKVSFKNGSILQNVVLYTTNTNDKSITAPNGLQLGKAGAACGEQDGVKFMTEGGFEVASGLQVYGSQVLAKGPIQFAAAADGIKGTSFISGETVDGTSNTAMGVCPNDNGEVFEVDLFRMAG